MLLFSFSIFSDQWSLKIANENKSTKTDHRSTLKCLSIGTPDATIYLFVSNEKQWLLGVPVFKHVIIML